MRTGGDAHPLRIVQVTHYMPPHAGGIERVAESLFDGLNARGHDVRWLALAQPMPAGEIDGRVRLSGTNFLEEQLGVPVPLLAPSSYARLADEVGAADVVLAHDCIYPSSAVAAVAARRARVPLLLIQHVGYVPYGRLDPIQSLAYGTLGRLTRELASAKVAVSAHVAGYFGEGFEHIPNGIDLTRFSVTTTRARAAARQKHGIAPDARVLVFAGRLVEKKGVRRVAGALPELRRAGVEVVVAGAGPLDSLLRDGGARMLGEVPADAMEEVYALGDALVLPSHGEGFPLTVQESRATGLASLVSDDPSYVENLRGRPGAVLIGPDDDLAKAASSLLSLPPERERIAADARTSWDLRAFLDRYEDRITTLAAESSRRGRARR